MRSSFKDMAVAFEMPEGTIHHVELGGMTAEFGKFKKTIDPSPLFKGLPNDRCQCPHWGFVIKGQLRYRFADREEVYKAGDVYYAPPGHLPLVEASEWVEFSPSDLMKKTMEVVARNMAAKQAAR